MIEVAGICKSFCEKRVLENVNMRFDDGRIYCLMGESGIGKTTLLRIIMGLEKPDSGSVRADAGRFAAVFQEDRLIKDETPIENILLVTKGQKHFGKRAEIAEAVSDLLPAECLDKNVGDLSGGMKRRVALARAMLSCGSAVLLDEPFTGLDDETRVRAIHFIQSCQNGRTVIAVTHNAEDARLLGADILSLS
jgi:NitT/TauT family transport system ATP-binding protein